MVPASFEMESAPPFINRQVSEERETAELFWHLATTEQPHVGAHYLALGCRSRFCWTLQLAAIMVLLATSFVLILFRQRALPLSADVLNIFDLAASSNPTALGTPVPWSAHPSELPSRVELLLSGAPTHPKATRDAIGAGGGHAPPWSSGPPRPQPTTPTGVAAGRTNSTSLWLAFHRGLSLLGRRSHVETQKKW